MNKMTNAMLTTVKKEFEELLDTYQAKDHHDNRLESIVESWWLITTMWLFLNDYSFDEVKQDLDKMYELYGVK